MQKKIKLLFSVPPREYGNILRKNIKKIKNKIRFQKKHFVQKAIKDDNDAYEQEKAKHTEIAKQCKLGVVEIGILDGETSKVLAAANPNILTYGIDPLIPDSMRSTMLGVTETIKENTQGLSNFNFIQDYSYNVVKGWNKLFDYIFIDGSHTYEDAKKDFEDWFPLLAQGGIVSFHDSTMNRGGLNYWEGSSKVADELIFDDRLEFIESVGRLTIFRKK